MERPGLAVTRSSETQSSCLASDAATTPGHWTRYRTAILTATLLALIAIWIAPIDFDPEAPGLGDNTTTIRDARVAGVPIRDNGRPVLEVLDSLPTRENDQQPIVWIGNSHQHAVNSMQPGDTVSSVYLHLALNGNTFPGRAPTVGISYPNLRYEEQFLLTLALSLRDRQRRPAVMVEGVRFHDAREMGVRSTLRPLFRLAPIKAWMEKPLLPAGEYKEAMERLRTDFALAVDEQRKEEGFEPWLVNTLGPHLPIFQQREFLYASIEDGIHHVRDRVFGIDTRTKRPMLESRYILSMKFIELALWIAHEQGVKVLLYNAPLRQEVENPYVTNEYARFRRDLAALAAKYDAVFQDYDDLIPRELWGTWYATDFPDFSHFTAAGHRLLAERVLNDIAGLLSADGDDQRGLK